jgi:hypothetical protein
MAPRDRHASTRPVPGTPRRASPPPPGLERGSTGSAGCVRPRRSTAPGRPVRGGPVSGWEAEAGNGPRTTARWCGVPPPPSVRPSLGEPRVVLLRPLRHPGPRPPGLRAPDPRAPALPRPPRRRARERSGRAGPQGCPTARTVALPGRLRVFCGPRLDARADHGPPTGSSRIDPHAAGSGDNPTAPDVVGPRRSVRCGRLEGVLARPRPGSGVADPTGHGPVGLQRRGDRADPRPPIPAAPPRRPAPRSPRARRSPR